MNAQHEKIFTRGDGSRVKVLVWVDYDFSDYTSEYKYDFDVTSNEVDEEDCHFGYNRLATPEEVQEAKMELWEKLKQV